MKPPFGTMNATIAKTIAQNAPKYGRIVEPFGDGGTFALFVAKRRPREHILNILDPALFAAMTFVQGAGAGDRASLKRLDWVASQETFDSVAAITATEGIDAFYRYLYVKKFGMQMDPTQPAIFDALKTGQDIRDALYALPMMKAGLKGVTISNDEPLSVISGGSSDTLWILLPKKPEDTDAVKSRVTGLSGSVFFAYKAKDSMEIIDAASQFGDMTVSAMSVASIMMSPYGIVTNFDSDLVPLSEIEGLEM